MEYTEDRDKAYDEIGLKCEDLWSEFITAFRPQTIKLLKRGTVTKWYELLVSRNVGMGATRNSPKYQLIIELLYKYKYYPQTEKEEVVI